MKQSGSLPFLLMSMNTRCPHSKTVSYCKRDLPLMERPDLEIHTNEQLKSEVLTAFVFAFFHLLKKF